MRFQREEAQSRVVWTSPSTTEVVTLPPGTLLSRRILSEQKYEKYVRLYFVLSLFLNTKFSTL
jgi:hypothetical protein